MRVLHITPDYPPFQCGVADFAFVVTRALVELGMTVDVLTTDDPAIRELTSSSTFSRSLRVHPTITNWDWRMWQPVARAVRDLRPDVVHLHYQGAMYHDSPAILFLPWALRAQGAHRPLVTTMHDIAAPRRVQPWRGIRRLLMDRLLYASDRVLVGNEQHLRYVEGGRHLNGRVEVLPIVSSIPVVPLTCEERSAVRRQLGLAEDSKLLTYFGLLREGKGIELLLSAVAYLQGAGRNIELLLIGDIGSVDPESQASYRERLTRHEASLTFTQAVHWAGHVPVEIASRLLQSSDVIVLPFEDGASTSRSSVAAALSQGSPLITTQGPMTPPAMRNGENMILVPSPADVPSLVQAISTVLGSSQLRERLRHGALQLAEEFSLQRVTRRLMEIYESVADARDPTARRGVHSQDGN
jgi:glycosyltransferase involved in cell wall biosynthesis